MWFCDTEDYLHTTLTGSLPFRNKMEVYFKILEYQIEITVTVEYMLDLCHMMVFASLRIKNMNL